MASAKILPRPEALPPSPSTVTQVCLPQVARGVSWAKILVVAALALVGAGGIAALYMAQFTSRDDQTAAINAHSATDGHPSLAVPLRDVSNRLIRVETQQSGMAAVQQRMDDKLDHLIDSLRLLSAYQYAHGAVMAAQPSSAP